MNNEFQMSELSYLLLGFGSSNVHSHDHVFLGNDGSDRTNIGFYL